MATACAVGQEPGRHAHADGERVAEKRLDERVAEAGQGFGRRRHENTEDRRRRRDEERVERAPAYRRLPGEERHRDG
jgi:hypothetical protein